MESFPYFFFQPALEGEEKITIQWDPTELTCTGPKIHVYICNPRAWTRGCQKILSELFLRNPILKPRVYILYTDPNLTVQVRENDGLYVFLHDFFRGIPKREWMVPIETTESLYTCPHLPTHPCSSMYRQNGKYKTCDDEQCMVEAVKTVKHTCTESEAEYCFPSV